MDLAKIFTWIFAALGVVGTLVGIVAGLLYIEEWKRNKYPKPGAGVMIDASPKSPTWNKLKSLAMILIVVSVLGVTISGTFWVNGLEEKLSAVQGQSTMLENRTFSIEKQFSEFSTPSLHCSLVGGGVLAAFGTTPPTILYQLKVVNSGSPSIAWKWRLEITFTTGQVIKIDATENPSGEVLINPNTKEQSGKLDNSNYLPNALLENPLPTGAGRRGWIIFPVNSATQDDLQRIGNICS